MALIATRVRHQQQVNALRVTISESRDFLRTIEKHAVMLELVELNPWIWDDPDCALTLNKNDLHFAILYHWRNREKIDFIVGELGYSLDFAARALAFDQLADDEDFSVNYFVGVAKRQLAADHGRALPDSAWDLLSDAELEAFGEFLENAAADARNQNGG